jgi:inosose dehydratase
MMKASYCTLIYEGNELLDALEDVQRAGYQGIELYPKDWLWALERYSLDEFGDVFHQFDLSVTGVMGGVLNGQKDLEVFRKAVHIAAAIGCPNVFFVAAAKPASEYNAFIRLAKKATAHAAEMELTALLHHHAGTLAETMAQTRDIAQSVNMDNFGICFDSVHLALFEEDLAGCLTALGDLVRYVHLKDIKKDRETLFHGGLASDLAWDNLDYIAQEYTGLGEGTINNEEIVHTLLDMDYDGWWVIEIERQEYARKEHAEKNLSRLRAYFSTYEKQRQSKS